MTELKIEQWPIDRLIPYARNPRRHDEAVPKMAGLIKEFGFKVPIVARSDGEVIDGHLRLKAAQFLHMETVPVVLADDWTPAQVKAFRLAVNKSAEWAEWDEELLALEIEDLKLEDFDLELIGFEGDVFDDVECGGLDDEKYTVKTDIPQYTPTGKDVTLSDCVNTSKYDDFIKQVESSRCSEDIKDFLRLAATRHIAFSYKNIAEFYASKADVEVQNLFEKLALVIIDYDDAMKNGYMQIRKELSEIVGGSDE